MPEAGPRKYVPRVGGPSQTTNINEVETPRVWYGKSVVADLYPDDEWLVVADSHMSKKHATRYSRGMGAGVVSIKGGRLEITARLLEKLGYLRDQIKCFFLFTSGNDLTNVNATVQEITGEYMKLVNNILEWNPKSIVITGTPILRAPDRRTPVESADWYQDRVGELDNSMWQADDKRHHHFVTDFLSADRGLKGTGIRDILYESDLTHLNEEGFAQYTQVLEFVFKSVNCDDFEGRQRLNIGQWDEFMTNGRWRSVLWKF